MTKTPSMAFTAEGLGKAYRIYPSPMHRLKEIILRRPQHRLFDALADVSFSVSQGEGFGIVGENGAGKSTLLKILANTLKPSSGTVHRNGRIAALLELGAGFNPELTGEENIFLNGYLLGLSKGEIEGRRQSIIDFSEIGDFVGQPVKTYSSGMVVRLAFSIAASVNPDILIIDEALAVGDMHFQNKCVDRMLEFREQGKTMIFCSHSMYMVKQLCSRAVWLNHGRISALGSVDQVVEAYNDYMREKDVARVHDGSAPAPPATPGEGFPALKEVRIVDVDDNARETFKNGETLRVHIEGTLQDFPGPVTVGVSILRNDNVLCYGVSTEMDGVDVKIVGRDFHVCVEFPTLRLLGGTYFIGVFLVDGRGIQPFELRDRAARFSVTSDSREVGMITMDHSWGP